MRNLHFAVDHPQLVDRPHVGRQPAVNAQHRSIHESRERTPIEELRHILPWVGVAILALALVVEAVDLRDLPRLVVAAQQRDAVRVARLEQQQHGHRLDTIVPAVDKVAHEDVAGVRALAAVAEELEQIVKLPVDVAADGHRARHRLHCALLEHDLLHVLAEVLEVQLRQQLAVADAGNPGVQAPTHGLRRGGASGRRRSVRQRLPTFGANARGAGLR